MLKSSSVVSVVRRVHISALAKCSSILSPENKKKISANKFFTPSVVEETLKAKDLKTREPSIGQQVLESLERLSLVNFANEAGLLKLKETVKFASVLRDVDTEGVEPLVTILEDRPLKVRPDVAKSVTSREVLLACASKTEDGYFVAPPGNIPLEPKPKDFWKVVEKPEKVTRN